jgi:alpha-glucosidase
MFPDFINPIREWWSEQYKVLINAGISGFWHDMNEPTSFTAWGDMCFLITLPIA